MMQMIPHGTQIWKYPLKANTTEIKMPAGATILHLAVQGGIPTLWVAVNPAGELVKRRFGTHGTGHPIDHAGTYIGTYFDGLFVWHVIEF